MAQGCSGIALIDQASRLLEQASTLDDLKSVRDVAEAARTFAKAARLGLELQNHAAEIKLRAERKVGAFLSEMHLRGGDRRSKRPRVSLKLDDLGITKEQSKRWQVLALVPESEFANYVQAQNKLDRELTASGLLRLAIHFRPRTKHAAGVGRLRNDPRRTTLGYGDIQLLTLVAELQNHAATLAEILRPLYEDDGPEIRLPERRLTGRLIREIRESLIEVDKRCRVQSPLLASMIRDGGR